MRRCVPLFLFSIAFFLVACRNAGDDDKGVYIGHLAEVAEEDIYFDYRISAAEGDDKLTIFLQFREGGEDGPSVVMDGAGRVELDGEILKVDSSGLSGAFYELQKPISTFIGNHRLLVSTSSNKYEENFHFEPMILTSGIPDTIRREDQLLTLGGLGAGELVRVLLTDTSDSDGINRLDTVRNGQILLSKTDLEPFLKGPLHLELHREFEKPLEKGTSQGGRISINYILKRDFQLQD